MKMDIQSLCCHCTLFGTNTLQACPLVLWLYISCFVIFVRHLKECHKIKYLFMLWIDKDVLDVKLLSPVYLDSSFEAGNYFLFCVLHCLFQNVIFESMSSPFVFPVIKLAFVWHKCIGLVCIGVYFGLRTKAIHKKYIYAPSG